MQNYQVRFAKSISFTPSIGFAPRPPAFGRWGLRPQTPISLWRLGDPPPDPQNNPPNCEFLATRLGIGKNTAEIIT